MTTPTDPATTMRFDVTIDDVEIGSFLGLDGLSAQYEVKAYAEGGENGFVHQLPGRLSYGTVKLTRPVISSPQGNPLTRWFRDLSLGALVVHTASICAYTSSKADQEVVARWSFTGVWPVRYTGPSFAADGSKVATEVFEFAHSGFLEG